MQPVNNDRFVVLVEGAASKASFATEADARNGMEALLKAGVIEMHVSQQKEEIAGITTSRQVKKTPPIHLDVEERYTISIPHDKEKQAKAALADIEHSIESPANLNARLIFEDRYAALNAQQVLLEKGLISNERHFTDMRRESGGLGKYEYVIEVPRDKVDEVTDVLKNTNLKGMPQSDKDASPAR